MNSPHIVVSMLSGALMLGLASVVPASDQRGTPPPQSQARGQSAKPPKTPPPTSNRPSKPATTPAATPAPKGPQTAGQHLAQQPQLSAKLQPLLPVGTDLQAAALGFKNLGDFVSAVHVSNNLGIPFDQLKLRLTGSDSVSLGQAIHDLRPTVDAAAEVKKAQGQARKDQEGGK